MFLEYKFQCSNIQIYSLAITGTNGGGYHTLKLQKISLVRDLHYLSPQLAPTLQHQEDDHSSLFHTDWLQTAKSSFNNYNIIRFHSIQSAINFTSVISSFAEVRDP